MEDGRFCISTGRQAEKSPSGNYVTEYICDKRQELVADYNRLANGVLEQAVPCGKQHTGYAASSWCGNEAWAICFCDPAVTNICKWPGNCKAFDRHDDCYFTLPDGKPPARITVLARKHGA